MTQKIYMEEMAKIWNAKKMARYKRDMKHNFVVKCAEGGFLSWGNGLPVIYGSKTDAKIDMAKNDTLITEEEWFNALPTE